MKSQILVASLVIVSLSGCDTTDASRASSSQAKSTTPDNSTVNVRDREGTTTTPLDQGESQPDITRTADIRKRVIDANLSLDAQNTKIITRDGRVTLRGPVKSDADKQQVVQIATEIAGANNVDDQLEVKPSNEVQPSN